ncbi:hypothetical protein ACF0H5_012152 [Mactra antiquata]
MPLSLKTELYSEQKQKLWPSSGRHILAQYDDKNIVVYQAFCPEIASYAVKNGKFGGESYSFARMTWIKTNFLWMMYRAGWATKKRQERILAITITKAGFDEILQNARGSGIQRNEGPDEVRLQWDPDHDPHGGKCDRRAVQLGLRGTMVSKFNDAWIQKIEDITDFVVEQHQFVLEDQLDKLITPLEEVYIPSDGNICCHVLLDGFTPERKVHTQNTVSILDGACCSELLEDNFKVVLQKQIENHKVSNVSEIILCLGGAFNPIHTRHVEVLVQSKQWIEENTHYRVVAGYFAVAPDGYVKRKCQKSHQKCIASEYRIKLAEIACEDIEWLHAYYKPVGSAGECGRKILHDRRWNAKVAVIVGADRAMNKAGHAKWHKKAGNLTVCVGRKGETEIIKQAYLEDVKLGLVDNDNFILIPQELDNVSSSEVRKKMSNVLEAADDGSKLSAMKEIVDLGWLTKKVGDYMLEHLQEMYIY